MQTVRQMASGLAYAGVSLLLVLGSIALSLAQARTAPISSPLPAGTTDTPTRTPATQLTPSAAAAATASPAATSTATWTPLADLDSGMSTAAHTTTGATSKPAQTSTTACGPSAGWIRTYIVQPGDTLFRIAVLHGIDVDVLRRANCKTGTLIYAGERLWVPFSLPEPTALTIIPTFPTPTDEATPTSSPTPTATVAS